MAESWITTRSISASAKPGDGSNRTLRRTASKRLNLASAICVIGTRLEVELGARSKASRIESRSTSKRAKLLFLMH